MQNWNEIKHFVNTHRDKIKTVALPIVVIAAVLFFWLYGNAQDSDIQTDVNPATDAVQEEQEETGHSDLYVDICGEVMIPGVYQVTEGTRLFEVIEKAGGLTSDADITVINRAEAVYDGQKIRILSYQETASLQEHTSSNGFSSAQETGSKHDDGKVNLNTADEAQLQTIPGIGPSKASRITEYRETNGPFRKIEDIKNVTGIGNKTFETIAEYLTVS